MLTCFDVANGAVSSCDGGRVVVCNCPDDAERAKLITEWGLDEHTLRSALDPEELGRVEYESDHTAIIFKRPKRYHASDNFLFKVTSVGLFLFEDKLLLVTNDPDPLFNGRAFTKVRSLSSLALKVLYGTVIHFEEHLRVMNAISDELEKQVQNAAGNRHLLHMFTLEKGLVYYLNAISSNGRVLDKLRNHASRFRFTEDDQDYLEDTIIENTQCFEMANTYSQVVSSLMDARASLVGNNLNVMMKNLNAIVIAVSIPSFFASMLGMSEFSMMIGGGHWWWAYPIFVAAMVGLGVLTFSLIRRLEQRWR